MRRFSLSDLVITLLVAGCFIAIALLDYGHKEQAVQAYDSFSSFDYQHGGYRAWFDMLHDEGVRVARMEQRPAYLNGSVSTLIVANNTFDAMLRAQIGESAGLYSEGDVAALVRWVQNGGRLIWLVDQANSLGLVASELFTPSETGLELPAVVKSKSLKDTAATFAPSALTSGVSSVIGSGRLRVPFSQDPKFAPLVADASGSVVGWYPLGKGAIVLVTDESLFENGRLASADNARLAYNLATDGLKPGDTVAFEEWSHGYQAGNTWWEILPRPFQIAFGVAALALLLALVGAAWRFGPAIPLPANDERTSSEYLTSVATLLERGDASRKAVRDLAQLALRAAARSVGLPDRAQATEIGARLRGTETGDQRAADLLALERIAGFERPTREELVHAAQLSLAIRKDLGDGLQYLAPRRSAAGRTA
ncbi:MAG TPA: DUF4350 domain-containing protein [Candidatus Acidoferrales bacterium]|nr:DUF4350 domain-containing protein [Candidatus Acidoferrales bacterium]